MKKIALTRRRFMSISGYLLSAATLPLPQFVFAAEKDHPLTAAFLNISQQLTGYDNLDPQLSARYFFAFTDLFPSFTTDFTALSGEPSVLTAMANSSQNRELALKIVHAWYTGTVGPNEQEEVKVIAYKDALMYRPTADGLPVPTYCFRGELWFSALPPGITQEPTIAATF